MLFEIQKYITHNRKLALKGRMIRFYAGSIKKKRYLYVHPHPHNPFCSNKPCSALQRGGKLPQIGWLDAHTISLAGSFLEGIPAAK